MAAQDNTLELLGQIPGLNLKIPGIEESQQAKVAVDVDSLCIEETNEAIQSILGIKLNEEKKSLKEDTGDQTIYLNPSDFFQFSKHPAPEEEWALAGQVLSDATDKLRKRFHVELAKVMSEDPRVKGSKLKIKR